MATEEKILTARIGVCDTHEDAVEAVKILENANFPMKEVSLIGRVEKVEDHLHVRSLDPVRNAPAIVGASAGTIVGLLTGLGVFAIPGFGFLYGAGAIIGTIGGFDLGLVTGGVISLLLTFGIDRESAMAYQEHLKNGKFLLAVQGPEKDIEKARELLKPQKGILFE